MWASPGCEFHHPQVILAYLLLVSSTLHRLLLVAISSTVPDLEFY